LGISRRDSRSGGWSGGWSGSGEIAGKAGKVRRAGVPLTVEPPQGQRRVDLGLSERQE
jgi:hypothetical protein